MDKLTNSAEHLKFMKIALELSEENIETLKGGPFGAVIVKDGEIIAAEANSVLSTFDPTAHAEINAIRAACKKLNRVTLEGCVLYTSCEPCPMCASAVYWAKLDAVYYANTKSDAHAAGFGDEIVREEIVKPLPERTLPFKHLAISEAIQAFKNWVSQHGENKDMNLASTQPHKDSKFNN